MRGPFFLIAIAILSASAGGPFVASAQLAQSTNAAVMPYVVKGDAIPKPLTDVPGDPKRGQAVVVDRKLGNCLACHKLPIAGEADPGNVGPPLAGVGKTLSAAQLRLRVVNFKAIDPTTIMPSFYRVDGLSDVDTKFAGAPILAAQQVEDVVAYLQTLK